MKLKNLIISVLIVLLTIGITNKVYGKYIDEKEIKMGNIDIEKTYTVTINCVNPNDNSIIESHKIENLKSGQMYNTTQPDIFEYYLESDSGNTSGIITNQDIEVTYYFKPYGVFAKYYDINNDGQGETIVNKITNEKEASVKDIGSDYSKSDGENIIINKIQENIIGNIVDFGSNVLLEEQNIAYNKSTD